MFLQDLGRLEGLEGRELQLLEAVGDRASLALWSQLTHTIRDSLHPVRWAKYLFAFLQSSIDRTEIVAAG